MNAADVVISRAGAMTLSELSYLRKPAILIPSPYVADNHQFKNAKALADADAALLVEEKDLAGGALLTATEQLFSDSSITERFQSNVASFSDPNVGMHIWKDIQKLLDQKQA
jgi:UDP-N-acetylglucosamine--N-acetylmuramyl-(pentapeptide) pyrophosphoryl-undecaprenol N-acetylglucosamine transferase